MMKLIGLLLVSSSLTCKLQFSNSGHVQPTYPNGWTERPSTTICYEKGLVNSGEKLNVIKDINGELVDKATTSTVEECDDLCKQYIQCQWWNYSPVDSICYLKKAGQEKLKRIHAKMHSGPRGSTDHCQPTVCYEKGFVFVGKQLNVFQDRSGVSVNYKASISTVDECIALCKRYGQCQWWNYNPVHSTCFLKKGSGIPRREIQDFKMYTGHRDSINQCRARSEEDQIFLVAQDIESVMIKECNEENKKVSVRVPVEMIKKHGIESMTLNDPSCVPTKTEAEWRFSFHSTQCGSIAHGSIRLSPMYRNNLNIVFSEGQFAGRQTKVPFICKFKPGIATKEGYQQVDEKQMQEYYEDYYNEDPYHEPNLEEEEEEEEMYGLKVHKMNDDEKLGATLLQTRSDSKMVAVGDKIHVSSHISAVPDLALAMEQCWLTNSSQVLTQASDRDKTLVTRGCPTSEAISLHWEEHSFNSAFSFQITEDLVEFDKFWIQCRMGLCSTPNAKALGKVGNLHRCINPKNDCVGEHEHQESTLQQITIRGPLNIKRQRLH